MDRLIGIHFPTAFSPLKDKYVGGLTAARREEIHNHIRLPTIDLRLYNLIRDTPCPNKELKE